MEKEFLIRNHGRADLVIESVVSTCGCTAALTDSKTVKPGGSTPLRVTLTAPEEPGTPAEERAHQVERPGASDASK